MTNSAKFNRQDVLLAVRNLFWEKGFHATSARDIQKATDLRPGSIYASFGNKASLFEQVLTDYAQAMTTQLDECISQADNVLEGLENFVRSSIIQQSHNQACEVCMLIKSNIELTSDNAKLFSHSQLLLNQFENKLTDIFKKAQACGELEKNMAAIDYARTFQIQFSGTRSYLYQNQEKELIEKLIKQMFKQIRTFNK